MSIYKSVFGNDVDKHLEIMQQQLDEARNRQNELEQSSHEIIKFHSQQLDNMWRVLEQIKTIPPTHQSTNPLFLKRKRDTPVTDVVVVSDVSEDEGIPLSCKTRRISIQSLVSDVVSDDISIASTSSASIASIASTSSAPFASTSSASTSSASTTPSSSTSSTSSASTASKICLIKESDMNKINWKNICINHMITNPRSWLITALIFQQRAVTLEELTCHVPSHTLKERGKPKFAKELIRQKINNWNREYRKKLDEEDFVPVYITSHEGCSHKEPHLICLNQDQYHRTTYWINEELKKHLVL